MLLTLVDLGCVMMKTSGHHHKQDLRNWFRPDWYLIEAHSDTGPSTTKVNLIEFVKERTQVQVLAPSQLLLYKELIRYHCRATFAMLIRVFH